MGTVRSSICLTLLALWPAVAGGQSIGANELLQAADVANGNLPPDTLGGELLFGQIDEDIFATLQLRLNFDRELWGIGVLVRVLLRIITLRCNLVVLCVKI